MAKASVTIGITSYNAADTILDAVRSAVDQSVPIAQIVLVDDCSSDDTLSVLRRSDFAPRLEIHRNPVNRGVAACRNEIIRRACGDFLAFFDDDDTSAPTRVEAQLTRILDYERDFAKGAPVICHTARRQVYPNGLERIEPTMGMLEGGPAPSGVKVARRALIGEPLADGYGSCATCSQMARTETYRRVGGFDESFRRCEDSDLAVRLALAGGHFVGLRSPLVTQTMTAASEKTLDDQRLFSLMWLDRHRTVFDSDAAYRFCRSWLEIKYDWLARDWLGLRRRLMKVGVRHPLWVARRIRMALPTLGGNRALRTFFRGMH
jgi:glycosyltransferase involved in cell wall biosynthesis